MLEEILNDVLFSLRRLLSNPLVSLSALVTLALGIGANATIFGVVYGTLLRPLPYPHPDRLVAVWERNLEEGLPRFRVAPPNFVDWQEGARSFEALAGVSPRRMNLAESGEPEVLNAARVSSGFWRVFDVRPVKGGVFGSAEDQPGGGQVAVISQGLWQRRFARDPGILGKAITLDARRYSVIGVMPGGFDAPGETEIWVPLALDLSQESRGSRYLNVFGRLRPEVSRELAKSELARIAANLDREYPGTNHGWGIDLESLHASTVENVRSSLLLLFAAVTAVLLMACMNVANLLLVQLLAREGEIAVRIAMGVSRLRLVRQLVTEGLVLGLLGGVLSLLVSVWGGRLLKAALPELAHAGESGLSSRMLVFALVVALLSGLLVGLLPALQSLGQHHYETLRQGRAGAGRRGVRTRAALVMAEMAFAVLLLIGAGLLIQSLYRLRSVAPGFKPGGILTLRLVLPETKYGKPATSEAFYQELLARLASLPGVESAGVGFPLPLDGSSMFLSYAIPGQTPSESSSEARNAAICTVSPGFFKALAIPLLRGRVFDGSDRADAPPVVVVNKTLAEREWPGGDPVGKRLTFDDPTSPRAVWDTVVGVVGNVRHKSLAEEASGEIYRTQLQSPTRNVSLVLRVAGDPLALSAATRREIQSIDPQLAVSRVQTMQDLVASSLAQTRSSSLLCGLFAALALILATVGIYGAASYSASQRAREIGIRMALGAQRGNVVGLMVRQGLRVILIGTGLGVGLALLALRSFASLVYGVNPYDPWTFALCTAALVLVGLTANLLPAQRIASIDPVLSLRQQ